MAVFGISDTVLERIVEKQGPIWISTDNETQDSRLVALEREVERLKALVEKHCEHPARNGA